MQFETMKDVLLVELKDLYSVEKQLVRALPWMAAAAYSSKLRDSIEFHLTQTDDQLERLERIFSIFGETPGLRRCKPIETLIEQSLESAGETTDPILRDAVSLAFAQKIELYEIAGYHASLTFARVLGLNKVSELLQATLSEEIGASAKLAEVARCMIQSQEEEPADSSIVVATAITG